MNSRLLTAVLGALTLTTALASAQTLALTGSAPTLDGVVAANEYSLSLPVGKITLSASRTADTVYSIPRPAGLKIVSPVRRRQWFC